MTWAQLTGFSYFEAARADPRYEVIVTAEAFAALIRRLEAARVIAFDTETSGLAWWKHARICGVSFTTKEGDRYQSAYVPVRHLTAESQLSEAVVMPAIGRILADPSKLIIAHNIKFDDHMGRREGWIIGGQRDDTMVRARLYDENQPAGLKHRAVVDLGDREAHLHEEMLDREILRLAKLNGAKKRDYLDRYGYAQIPIHLCGLYAGRDTEYTYRLHERYGDIPQRFPRIYATEMRLTRVLCDMEETGVPIDVEYLTKLREDLERERHEIEGRVWEAFGYNHRFELSEDEQLRYFMQRVLKLELWKKTRRGKLSVDREVLEYFSDDVPSLRLILDWREATKLSSTYTDSILEKLDDRAILHCNFQQLGASSGRVSCSEPNLQNIASDNDDRALEYSGKKLKDGGVDPWSIHRAFSNRGPGWARLYFDYCVTGDTSILTAFGPRPIKDVRAGDLVLACNAAGELAFRKVRRQARIKKAPVLKLTLEDGSEVRCTADHKWMRLDGEMVETRSLRAGDRLMHVHSGRSGRYPTWYVWSNRSYRYKHHLVAEALFGERPVGAEIDHIDHDPENWRGDNLRYLSVSENRGQAAGTWWAKASRKQREGKIRDLVRGQRESRRSYVGAGNPNFGKLKGALQDCANCGLEFYASPSRKQKFCSSDCYWKSRNHRVRSISLAGSEYVYQITVDDFHTYVLENGLVSGNSQIELRVLTHYTQDPVLLEAYQTGQDIHTRTSLEVFGTDDPAKRRLSKIINFGLTYCLSSVGFARQARISEAEAEEHFARFHQRYAGIPAFRERFWAYVRQNGGTFANLFGRERHVPMINARLGKDRARAERQAIGALIQGQAAELTKESLCRIADWFEAEGLPALICQTIHDEIQIDTPIECLGRVAQGSKWIMENYPEFQPVPIVTGAAYSTENWARKKPLPGL